MAVGQVSRRHFVVGAQRAAVMGWLNGGTWKLVAEHTFNTPIWGVRPQQP
jgi:hypothetical protein